MKITSRRLQGIGSLIIGLALAWGAYTASKTFTVTYGKNISVTGTATEEISPNQVTVSGSWEEERDTAKKARKATREKASKGLEAIKKLGINKNKINTDFIAVTPATKYVNGESKIVGYRASTSISVVIEDTSKAEKVLNAMISSGAARTSGPSTGLTKEYKKQLRKKLLVKAIDEAHSLAQVAAKRAGRKLGGVVSIGSNNPLNYGSVYNGLRYSSATPLMSKAAGGSDLNLGDKEATLSVSVIFALK